MSLFAWLIKKDKLTAQQVKFKQRQFRPALMADYRKVRMHVFLSVYQMYSLLQQSFQGVLKTVMCIIK